MSKIEQELQKNNVDIKSKNKGNKKDLVKDGIINNLLQSEKNYLLSKRDIKTKYQYLLSYSKTLEDELIDRMLISDLTEITYHTLEKVPILKEIPISELAKNVTENILPHIMVTIDLEATRNSLRSNLGITDLLIDKIIENIEKIETTTILKLVEKEGVKV